MESLSQFCSTFAADDVAQNVVTLKLALFAGIIVLSIGLGWALEKLLRLPETASKFGLILFTIGLGLSPFLNAMIVKGQPWTSALRFGIDLAGGTNLVYQLERPPTNSESGLMDRMVGAVRKRIDPSSTQELTIRQVGIDRIEVIIPGADPEVVAKYKKMMTTVGSLEFDILANRKDDKSLIERAQTVRRNPAQPDKLLPVRDDSGRVIAAWAPIAPKVQEVDGERKEVPNGEFTYGGEIVTRQIAGKPEGFEEVLVVIDPIEKNRVTGKYLQRSAPTSDESGRPAVSFTFTMEGATLFSRLTGSNLPDQDGFQRRLAILLDERVHSAPGIRSTIGASGIIEGSFTMEQVNDLVGVLNAGALDIPLKRDPISEFSISPTLGIDVQNKGKLAIMIATISVFAFMLLYYVWVGVVADICLLLNLTLLMGSMALIEATFTLPGLAGVVLTMGMAVDANVLIFERIREELHRGSSQRLAIQNGFQKAFSSIFDSNITTLLTAVILYMIGTDQVKGFAVTLFIGIALSMYTSLYVNRLFLEVIERKRWIKKLTMRNPIGETSFDFVGKQRLCAVLSFVVISVGMFAFGYRGESNLDIDFSGGTMITFEFSEKLTPEESADLTAEKIGQKLTESFDSEITLEQLRLVEDKEDKKRFRMRTTITDQDLVQKTVSETFPGLLNRVTMEVAGDIKPIPEVTPPETEEGETSPEPTLADLFAGGHLVELKFSSELGTDTVSNYLTDALAQINNDEGQPRYGTASETESLISLTGPVSDKAEVEIGKVQKFVEMTLRTEKSLTLEDLQTALASASATMAGSPLFEEVNNFESSVANDAQRQAILAILCSLVMIVAYIWFRFQNVYFGFAAVLALLHDVLAVLGLTSLAALASGTPIGAIFMLSDFKINLTMIAAFLTIVGYSLNDTIIIFDRLREIRGKSPTIDRSMLNLSVNQTLTRTLLTAGTTFIVVAILYVFGGEGIHAFAFAMLMGVVVGTYSTVYIASPFVLWLMNRQTNSPTKKQAVRAA